MFKPLKYIAMTFYFLLPFFEKPGWCLLDASINEETTKGYWFCNNEEGTIANSHLPKLPAHATNTLYLICLITLAGYTKARDFYRRRDIRGDTVSL